MYVAIRDRALGVLEKGAVVRENPGAASTCDELAPDLAHKIQSWGWIPERQRAHGLLPVNETGNLDALLAGKFVKGINLSKGERIWLDERRKRSAVWMSSSASSGGFLPFHKTDANLDHWLSPKHNTAWWFSLKSNPIDECEHKEPKMNMKRAYVVATTDTVQPLLKKLEASYPKLRWTAGAKPTAAKFESCSPGLPFMLSLDPALAYCEPWLASVHPGLVQDNLCFAQNLEGCMELAKKVYGDPEPERITRAWLKKQGACAAGLAWFDASFGKNAKVAREALRAAATAKDASWGLWLDARK